MHGMWIMNWIPLIIPHSYDRLAFIVVFITAVPIVAVRTTLFEAYEIEFKA
jgi:hypothetical protein